MNVFLFKAASPRRWDAQNGAGGPLPSSKGKDEAKKNSPPSRACETSAPPSAAPLACPSHLGIAPSPSRPRACPGCPTPAPARRLCTPLRWNGNNQVQYTGCGDEHIRIRTWPTCTPPIDGRGPDRCSRCLPYPNTFGQFATTLFEPKMRTSSVHPGMS